MARIILRQGRDKSVHQKHPWIYSGSVAKLIGNPGMGETVEVCSIDDQMLGWAAYSPQSNIRARMLSWDINEVIDGQFIKRKLQQALALRCELIPAEETNAYRIVHAESDGLPGLIVDRYERFLVVQCLTAGIESWKTTIIETLVELTGLPDIFERSDVDVRRLEGLPEIKGVLHGEEPPDRIQIHENNLRFWVDIRNGQKTGFFLDQRCNRQMVRQMIKGGSVLNCFGYTGAFAVYALAGGAEETISIDTSAGSLSLGAENVTLNNFPPEQASWVEGDVFYELRKFRDCGRCFDAIILDPPKFAPTSAQAERAARGYKDINLLAFKLLKPGGLLFTFSCSGGISIDLFRKIVAGAALDAGVDVVIVRTFSQGTDHPISLQFPEGSYLKGLACCVR